METVYGDSQPGPDWGFPPRQRQAEPASAPERDFVESIELDESLARPRGLSPGESIPLPATSAESASLINRLLAELGLVQAERNRLRQELDAATHTLAYTEGELKSLWGVLTGRNVKRAVRYATGQARDFARLTPETDERARIRAKIMRVRTLARRRRWPWALMHRSGA